MWVLSGNALWNDGKMETRVHEDEKKLQLIKLTTESSQVTTHGGLRTARPDEPEMPSRVAAYMPAHRFLPASP